MVKMHIEMNRYQLDNGLILLHCLNNHLPIVSVNAFFRVGKDQNPDDKAGLASITSRLLDEGTERYSSRELSLAIENVGGEVSTFSERELTGICLQLNAADLGLGIELLAEMAIRPTFPEDRYVLEHSKVLNHIQSINDDPEAVGSHTLNRLIYRGSPLAAPVLGVTESLERITVEDLHLFHQTKYGPQNTILTVVGDVEFERTIEKLLEHFSGWSNQGLHLRTPPRLYRQTEPVTELVPMRKNQTTVYVGHLGVERKNPDFYSLQVADTVLGGGPGFTSRIPKELRDNQGLAYSAYSDLTGSSGIYPGRFVAYACTSPENRDKAHRGLHSEIERLIEDGVSREELSTAKQFLTGSFVFEFQGNTSIARYLLARELFELEDEYPKLYEQSIHAVTQSEVQRVARKYLDTINYSTVFAGSV